MYLKKELLTIAKNLVGWSNSTDPQYKNISSDYYAPQSGYYVNDLPGISVNILNYVSSEKKLTTYIDSIHNSETLKVVDAFLAKQKKDLSTKELLSNITLLQGYNDLKRYISRSSRFVGYVITPRESKSIVSSVKQIGFISSAPQSFDIYLYCTSQNEYIEKKTITILKANTLEWTVLNWEVYFDSELYGAGERYFIGYFENELSADLYEQDWTGNQAHISQKICGHYMGISPFRFSSTAVNGNYLPNVSYLQSALNCQTPGFNLRFNVKCDITRVLADNIQMFGQAIQYQIAVRILQDAMSNIELNNITSALQHRETWREMIADYNGKLHGGYTDTGSYIPGIIDRLSIDFSSIDAVCLKNKAYEIHGVKW